MLTAAASDPVIWDGAAETMPREQLAALQLERLRALDRPDERTLVLAAQLNSRLRKDLA